MGPVTIILSDKPITHNTVKSIVANIPTKRRGPDLRGVIQTVRSHSTTGSPSCQYVSSVVLQISIPHKLFFFFLIH